jgi:hypothetical protein
MKAWELPYEVDERLWAWGRHFRDRRSWTKCGSAEGNYKPHSDDYALEGWDAPTPPPVQPGRSRTVLEAIETNEAVMKLMPVQKWSLTYFFCYPHLPRFVILKALRKFAGRRLTWAQYLEQVDYGRMRIYTLLSV